MLNKLLDFILEVLIPAIVGVVISSLIFSNFFGTKTFGLVEGLSAIAIAIVIQAIIIKLRVDRNYER